MIHKSEEIIFSYIFGVRMVKASMQTVMDSSLEVLFPGLVNVCLRGPIRGGSVLRIIVPVSRLTFLIGKTPGLM